MNPISNSFGGSVGVSLPLPSAPDLELKLSQLKEASEKQAEQVGMEFESVFVSLMLKEMRNTLDSGEGGLFGSEQSDTFGGMFDQFMGQHLAEASPFGIADAIKSYLKNVPLT